MSTLSLSGYACIPRDYRGAAGHHMGAIAYTLQRHARGEALYSKGLDVENLNDAVEFLKANLIPIPLSQDQTGLLRKVETGKATLSEIMAFMRSERSGLTRREIHDGRTVAYEGQIYRSTHQTGAHWFLYSLPEFQAWRGKQAPAKKARQLVKGLSSYMESKPETKLPQERRIPVQELLVAAALFERLEHSVFGETNL